jgi:hypothetical protein
MSGVDHRKLADSYRPNFGIPWVPVLSEAQLNGKAPLADGTFMDSYEKLWRYHNNRKQQDQWALEKPVSNGWIFPAWQRVMDHWRSHRIHIILGGNRSGKSTLAARLMVWCMGNIPEFEGRAFHVNDKRSKEDQQREIHRSLPLSLKNLPTKAGVHHQTRWTQANGFTNNMVILPPLKGWTTGGRIDFCTYSSYSNDPQVAEGFRAHAIWLDEEAPLELFRTLMLRTTDFHGRIIMTFTTLNGWTPLVNEILGSVKTLESRYAPLVGKKLPVLQESTKYPGMMVHFFWTQDNEFIDNREFSEKMKGLSTEDVMARAYGIPTKAAKAAFPLFSRDVHVLEKHEDLPWIKNPGYEVTFYHICDPGGSKNDFMGWVAIDRAGTWWCYREWPDMDTYGEWALPGPTVEGKPGPAQTSLGWGYEREAQEIRTLEGSEDIFERLVDPRMGAQEKKGQDGATNFITDFDKHDITFVPAPGVDIKSGLKKINELLQYDPEKPRDSRNCPKMFFSPKCGNWIHMMQEYTATYTTEHTKEGPDLLRYLAQANPQFVAKEDMQATGTEM